MIANPVAAALRAARDRHSSGARPRASRREAATEELFIAEIIGQRHPAGAPGRNGSSQNGCKKNPDRREQKRSPRKREMNCPTKKGAVYYARQHQRKTNSRCDSYNRGERAKHCGF